MKMEHRERGSLKTASVDITDEGSVKAMEVSSFMETASPVPPVRSGLIKDPFVLKIFSAHPSKNPGRMIASLNARQKLLSIRKPSGCSSYCTIVRQLFSKDVH
jgi:hypothetical protein